MQFSQDIDTSAYVIRGYGPGEVTINEPLTEESIIQWSTQKTVTETPSLLTRRTLTRSAVISPRQLIEDWPAASPNDINAEQLAPILAMKPEIVLFGTGSRLSWPPAATIAALHKHGIGVEVMDTAAACRTYNILMLEGRRVAAALLMI